MEDLSILAIRSSTLGHRFVGRTGCCHWSLGLIGVVDEVDCYGWVEGVGAMPQFALRLSWLSNDFGDSRDLGHYS